MRGCKWGARARVSLVAAPVVAAAAASVKCCIVSAFGLGDRIGRLAATCVSGKSDELARTAPKSTSVSGRRSGDRHLISRQANLRHFPRY